MRTQFGPVVLLNTVWDPASYLDVDAPSTRSKSFASVVKMLCDNMPQYFPQDGAPHPFSVRNFNVSAGVLIRILKTLEVEKSLLEYVVDFLDLNPPDDYELDEKWGSLWKDAESED